MSELGQRARQGEREYDLIVFGVSGFTGKLVARYLEHLHISRRLPLSARVAYAGRNLQAIRLLARELSPKLAEKPSLLGYVFADVSDAESVYRMACSAKVVLTCVGPYEQFGEIVVKACVSCGTDYVDITGEGRWIERMKLTYESSARRNGVILVPFAGQDCVPADLCAWFATSQIPPIELEESHAVLRTAWSLPPKGGMSHGTFQTVLNFLEKGELDQYDIVAVPKPRLNHAVQVIGQIPEREGGPITVFPTRTFVDAKVIHESHQKLQVGRPGALEVMHGFVVPNRFVGQVGQVALRVLPYLIRFPFVLPLLRRAIKSGAAIQSPKLMDASRPGAVVSTVYGALEVYPLKDAEIHSRVPIETVVVKLDMDRTPYEVTAVCCTQIALALSNEAFRETCPGLVNGAGFHTPSSALGGQALFERCYECFRASLVSRL